MSADQPPAPHKRRPRYAGTHPRRFEEKYKEHDPQRYADTVARVMASGKTPAGMHRPIMVAEILDALAPKPGDIAVDCTLGYGGHAQEILGRIQPGGKLIGIDADPLELARTETRLHAAGFGTDIFMARRSNFAGLPKILTDLLPWTAARQKPSPAEEIPSVHSSGESETGTGIGWTGADLILADLGVSSMQLDDPTRGFSMKHEGPLDMRMNPERGSPASALLERISPDKLALLLAENADEPHAALLAPALAGKLFPTTKALADAICAALPRVGRDEVNLTFRRVFQALRIAVNDEFSALETFLRYLPGCLNPGGRVAILTFHSGEDRRVKKAFTAGRRDAVYEVISAEVIRPSAEERNSNPRSAAAKLRWARRA